jgi:hypothetical protein
MAGDAIVLTEAIPVPPNDARFRVMVIDRTPPPLPSSPCCPVQDRGDRTEHHRRCHPQQAWRTTGLIAASPACAQLFFCWSMRPWESVRLSASGTIPTVAWTRAHEGHNVQWSMKG